ncbi:MAG: ADP-ribosyltransferase [Candidatus Methanoplasma sp.]|nr:ADP-ribosyltransferase [Candidatus Methanoplasma sp.]
MDVKSVLDDVKNIDRAISDTEAPVMTLYRKCDPELDFSGLKKATPGENFRFPSYMSTSVSKESAYAFTHPGEVVEIRFPGGKGGGTFLGDMSEWTTEYEFLLKRNTLFRLSSVPKVTNKRYVLEVVL